jgi:hypothetical protein
LVNAVTRVAQDVDQADRAYELEKAASEKVLEMTAGDWKDHYQLAA